jgi:hypothetical protein
LTRYTDSYGNTWDSEHNAQLATAMYTAFDTQPNVSDEEIVVQLALQFPDEDLEELDNMVACVRDAWLHSTEVREGKKL